MTQNTARDRPLISVHVPKAGGTALASQLQAAYGADRILLSYDGDPADPANPLWWNRDWFLDKRPSTLAPFAVVHGHIPVVKYDLIAQAHRIAMLREPVANIISIYFYWQSLFANGTAGHAIFEFVKQQRLTLLETAQIPQLRWLMSRTYFQDYDMRRFDVIGAHERRAAFMEAVSGLIEKPLSPTEKTNITPPSSARDEVMNDSRLLARLRDLLADDIRFYDTHTAKH
jgi:hypothetical protein